MNPIQELKEDYECKANTYDKMYKDHLRTFNPDVIAIGHVDVKASLYREFASELGEVLQDQPKPLGADFVEDLHVGPAWNAAGRQVNDLDL